jgi:hypothetical protein
MFDGVHISNLTRRQQKMRMLLKMKILATYKRQTDFCRACGKSDDWLSRIITGKKDPNDEEKKLILTKLKMPNCDYLFSK